MFPKDGGNMFLQNTVSIPKIDGFTYWKTSGLYGSIRKIAPCKSMKVTQIIIKFPDTCQHKKFHTNKQTNKVYNKKVAGWTEATGSQDSSACKLTSI